MTSLIDMSTCQFRSIGCTFRLKPEDVIFGICNLNDDNVINIVNYCILMAKYYIAETRKKEDEPNLFDYLRFIKYKLNLDLVHSKIENREQHFVTHWSLLYDSL